MKNKLREREREMKTERIGRRLTIFGMIALLGCWRVAHCSCLVDGDDDDGDEEEADDDDDDEDDDNFLKIIYVIMMIV